MIRADQWKRVLGSCGVKQETAARWAPLWERFIQAESFSVGARELDDFTGQVLWETTMLEHLVENLDYRAERIVEMGNRSPPGSRWHSLIPRAYELAHRPEAFANAVYGGRNGNTEPGDGWRFIGRGIPMVTGRRNYENLQRLTGMPLLDHPEQLADPATALRCGVLWWEGQVPDSAIDFAERVTKAVQGADEALKQRATLTDRAGLALALIAT